MTHPRDSRGREILAWKRDMRWLARAQRYEREIPGLRGYRRTLLEERVLSIKVRLGLSLDAPLPETLPKPEATHKGDTDKRGRSVSKRLERLSRAKPTTARAEARLRISIYRAAEARRRKRQHEGS